MFAIWPLIVKRERKKAQRARVGCVFWKGDVLKSLNSTGLSEACESGGSVDIVQTGLLCEGAFDLQLQTASATEFPGTNGERLLNGPAGGLPQTGSFLQNHFDFYHTQIFERNIYSLLLISPYKWYTARFSKTVKPNKKIYVSVCRGVLLPHRKKHF